MLFLYPLLHSVPLLGHYKKLHVKKRHSIFKWKMSHFSHQRSLATELTTFYLENKSHASMGWHPNTCSINQRSIFEPVVLSLCIRTRRAGSFRDKCLWLSPRRIVWWPIKGDKIPKDGSPNRSPRQINSFYYLTSSDSNFVHTPLDYMR